MKRNIVAFVFAVLMVSCSSPEQRIISQVGDNGSELQKVLDHFKTDTCKEKYEAAKFLIRNIGGHFSFDTTHLSSYRPYLDTVSCLFESCKENQALMNKKMVNSWKEFKENNNLSSIRSNYWYDYQNIKADYLIKDIELAFKAWKENPYTSQANINEFYEYVLPYRRSNGKSTENWREYFYNREKLHFKNYYPIDLIKACDTLLYNYKELKHNYASIKDYPLLKLIDFEQLKRGSCGDKCWYNSMLFSSLGIACAIDFVPKWGNRNGGHAWNVIIHNGVSYAFEPFWDTERWKYKRIYNNVSWDDQHGKFRLPKVYRNTYSNHIEDSISDSRVESNDIPGLFRNVKKMDVSDEYFETEDVEIDITEKIPENTNYCYLCVFGHQAWHPVQWGEIKGSKVQFKGMGKDIIYLPCFYKEGELINASDPFLLTANGDVKNLTPNNRMNREISVDRVCYLNPNSGNGIKELQGSRIEVSNDSLFSSTNIIYEIPDTMLYAMNIHQLKSPISKRYIRLVFPTDTCLISELCFYQRNENGKLDKLIGGFISGYIPGLDGVGKAFDGLVATDFESSKAANSVENISNWIGVDFGKETRIDAIGYCPGMSCDLWEHQEFELFYWKDGWRSVAKMKGSDKELIFSKVPENALLMLKNINWSGRSSERIFLYEEGEQKWY